MSFDALLRTVPEIDAKSFAIEGGNTNFILCG